VEVLDRWLDAAVNTEAVNAKYQSKVSKPASRLLDTSLFDSPIFIVAAPRSGSTMLFETLQENMELWTLGDESHQLFESIKALHPAAHKFASNGLDESDFNDEIGATLVSSILRKLRNSRGTLFSQIPPEQQSSSLRFLEKTPKNALRIPFLRKLFPNAMFVYLYRSARPNIGSIIDAWESEKFITYPNLPNWQGPKWSLLLPEQWRRFNGKPLAQIAAWQWATTNRKIIQDLNQLPNSKRFVVNYEKLLKDKKAGLEQICSFADIPFGPRMQAIAKQGLPNSKYTLTEPAAEKWKRHEQQIECAIGELPEVSEVENLISKFACTQVY